MNLIPIDEVNALRTGLDLNRDNLDPEQIVDEVLEILIYSYMRGVEYVRKTLKYNYDPLAGEMYAVIYKRIKGENFEDRIMAHAILGDTEGIMLVVDTDVHRVYNDAVDSGGREYERERDGDEEKQNYLKEWNTMQDDKVRDTHYYLHGMRVGINDDFYTYDGDHAPSPGNFEMAQNNCNCRCWIEYVPDDNTSE